MKKKGIKQKELDKLSADETIGREAYWSNFYRGIEKMMEESDVFQFIHDEPDIYTEADIKTKY